MIDQPVDRQALGHNVAEEVAHHVIHQKAGQTPARVQMLHYFGAAGIACHNIRIGPWLAVKVAKCPGDCRRHAIVTMPKWVGEIRVTGLGTGDIAA